MDHPVFHLEAKAIETLGDPENSILRKGGHIFMVYADAKPVGCVALMPMGNSVYELSKMAISPHLRGQGIGRRLLQHAIAQAKLIGAKSLFSGSSTKLPRCSPLRIGRLPPCTARDTAARALHSRERIYGNGALMRRAQMVM